MARDIWHLQQGNIHRHIEVVQERQASANALHILLGLGLWDVHVRHANDVAVLQLNVVQVRLHGTYIASELILNSIAKTFFVIESCTNHMEKKAECP